MPLSDQTITFQEMMQSVEWMWVGDRLDEIADLVADLLERVEALDEQSPIGGSSSLEDILRSVQTARRRWQRL